MLIFYERILQFSKLRSMHLLGDINNDEEYDMSGIFEPTEQGAQIEGKIGYYYDFNVIKTAQYIILFPVQIQKHNSTFPKDAVRYLSLC